MLCALQHNGPHRGAAASQLPLPPITVLSLSVLGFHINEIVQNTVFSAWLLLLGVISEVCVSLVCSFYCRPVFHCALHWLTCPPDIQAVPSVWLVWKGCCACFCGTFFHFSSGLPESGIAGSEGRPTLNFFRNCRPSPWVGPQHYTARHGRHLCAGTPSMLAAPV